MEMSIEMKMQALDKMIEMRNQLIVMQDNLGVFNGLDKDGGILIYSTEEFLEIVKHAKAKISVGVIDRIDDKILSFNYNGTEFHTFTMPCEYEKYRSAIDLGGGENV